MSLPNQLENSNVRGVIGTRLFCLLSLPQNGFGARRQQAGHATRLLSQT